MHPRNLAALGYDCVAAMAAWSIAFWLRFNFDMPEYFVHGMLRTLAPVVLLQAAAFLMFGLYRGMWRYASVSDLQRIVFAVGAAAVAVPALVLLFEVRRFVPRSVFILDPILLVMLMGGARFAYRAWKEHRLYGHSVLRGEPVVVIGAGQAGAALVRDLQRSDKFRAVALFDDAPALHGQLLHGVRVVGGIADLPAWAARAEVRRVVVAMPSAAAGVRRRAVETAQQAGLSVLTVPAFDDLVAGRISISQLRNVELEDLLGREQVELDTAGLERFLGGRTVLVTGAGGSIGSELCRQVARHNPARIILYEANEFALYRITEEFAARGMSALTVPVIGDIKDEIRTRAVFDAWRPSVVFHAAAYKHVPLMEADNAWQAVRNNVFGTFITATLAREFGAEKFVLVSTDKAVNPTNVMGATKRLAEMVCQSLDASAAPGAARAADGAARDGAGRNCKFVTVRFGNVLGSAGSVIPKFKEQIAAGGPITVTHPDIERYFMSIPEAAQLVLQAALMGEGGEIFVLDMGEPIRIADLARDMVRLSGLTEEDVKIVFTGLRPGEKLYEELLADDEQTLRTAHAKIRIARSRMPESEAWRERLIGEVRDPSEPGAAAVRAWLKVWVAEYRPGSGAVAAAASIAAPEAASPGVAGAAEPGSGPVMPTLPQAATLPSSSPSAPQSASAARAA